MGVFLWARYLMSFVLLPLVFPLGRKVRNTILRMPEAPGKREGIVIAASDYIRSYSDQVRPYISKPFYSFGTDGYGRSDSRKKLREFFEIDKEHIVAYALSALAKEQLMASKDAVRAMKKYKINKNKPIPTLL